MLQMQQGRTALAGAFHRRDNLVSKHFGPVRSSTSVPWRHFTQSSSRSAVKNIETMLSAAALPNRPISHEIFLKVIQAKERQISKKNEEIAVLIEEGDEMIEDNCALSATIDGLSLQLLEHLPGAGTPNSSSSEHSSRSENDTGPGSDDGTDGTSSCESESEDYLTVDKFNAQYEALRQEKMKNETLQCQLDNMREQLARQAAEHRELKEHHEKLLQRRTADYNKVMEYAEVNRNLDREFDEMETEYKAQIAEKDQECNRLDKEIKQATKSKEETQHQYQQSQEEVALLEENQRRLLEATLEKEKISATQVEECKHQTAYAVAETQDNLQKYADIVTHKNADIGRLENLINCYIVAQPPNMQHVVETVQNLRKENKYLRSEVQLQKQDIQNLLAISHDLSSNITKRMDEARVCKGELTEARNALAIVHEKLDQEKATTASLKGCFDDIVTRNITNHDSSQDTGSPNCSTCIEITTRIVSQNVCVMASELGAARDQLRSEVSKNEDLQSRLDKCENEVFMHRFEEEFRQSEMRGLKTKLEGLEAAKGISDAQVQQFKDFILSKSSGKQFQDALSNKLAALTSLQDEVKRLRMRQLPLEEGLENLTAASNQKIKELEAQLRNYETYFANWDSLYYDQAVYKNDDLNEELAKYKKMCGETHFVESRHPDMIVHERRMLQFACQNAINGGDKGTEPNDIPKEFFDSNFVTGWHPAIQLALMKIAPSLWQLHLRDDKWIAYRPPTVPMLTDNGVLDLDDAESHSRLLAAEREMRAAEEKKRYGGGHLSNLHKGSIAANAQDQVNKRMAYGATCVASKPALVQVQNEGKKPTISPPLPKHKPSKVIHIRQAPVDEHCVSLDYDDGDDNTFARCDYEAFSTSMKIKYKKMLITEGLTRAQVEAEKGTKK